MIFMKCANSENIKNICIDLIFTDPPFNMSGEKLFNIFNNFQYKHLLLICTMRQCLEFYKKSNELDFCFDLVLDHSVPKKSRSYNTPNILHSCIVYFKKTDEKSAFDRRLIKRCDHYSDDKDNYYYPSIFKAPKIDMKYKYQKNQNMINDLVGSFNVKSVCDPFAGSGTVGLACLEHNKDCYLFEQDDIAFNILENNLSLFSDVKTL